MNQIAAKTILSAYSKQGWFGSNYTMNLYRGCCHGCIYCDSRSACYGIAEFDTVMAKEQALSILQQELSGKRKKGIVMTGAMGDPYNPFEKQQKLTRGALELLHQYGYGVILHTKSALAVRDIDLLQKVSLHSPAIVNFTVTTAEDSLCRQLERKVCVSSERFAALARLAEAGVVCGVLATPILPFINDNPQNLTRLVSLAAKAGAKWIYAGESFGVTLRQNQRDYFYLWLDRLFPGLRQQYGNAFGENYYCVSGQNQKLRKLFQSLCREYGLLYSMDSIAAYIQTLYQNVQLSLWDEIL